uniref:HAD family hydrolase n=1 Tax=candidate division CPR3 bacterium TaxID=2268181 RepID=A0A7V3N5S1_UNCC3
MIKNVIFDLDGTVVDSADDIIECLKHSYSFVPEYKDVTIERKVIGPPLVEMIKTITPGIKEDQIKMVIEEYRKCYDLCDFSRTLLFPGVRELLHSLCSVGIKVFLITNKPIFPTYRILEKVSIHHFFTDIVTPDIKQGESMNKKEMVKYLIEKWKLEKEGTLFISDRASDIHAAHENGVAAIGVLYGYSNRDEIVESQPEYICNNATEIKEIVRRWENE